MFWGARGCRRRRTVFSQTWKKNNFLLFIRDGYSSTLKVFFYVYCADEQPIGFIVRHAYALFRPSTYNKQYTRENIFFGSREAFLAILFSECGTCRWRRTVFSQTWKKNNFLLFIRDGYSSTRKYCFFMYIVQTRSQLVLSYDMHTHFSDQVHTTSSILVRIFFGSREAFLAIFFSHTSRRPQLCRKK